MKDESPLALIQVLLSTRRADSCSGAARVGANPTREESCLQSSHHSRALVLHPLPVALLEKNDSSALKIDAVSLPRQSDAAYLAAQQGK